MISLLVIYTPEHKDLEKIIVIEVKLKKQVSHSFLRPC
jgi:hypothetical protein